MRRSRSGWRRMSGLFGSPWRSSGRQRTKGLCCSMGVSLSSWLAAGAAGQRRATADLIHDWVLGVGVDPSVHVVVCACLQCLRTYAHIPPSLCGCCNFHVLHEWYASAHTTAASMLHHACAACFLERGQNSKPQSAAKHPAGCKP